MSNLLRSNLIVASGTALSRISGLLRVMVFGWVLGQTPLTDAYLTANETPNIIYDLLLGGVLSATLVPLFSQFVETDDDEATNVIVTVASTLMVVLTGVAVVAAPFIFRLYAITVDPSVDPEAYRSVGATLTRIFLIQILFYGLSGLANSFLNARRRFFAASWGPVVSNAIIIASLLTLRGRAWTLADVITDSRLRYTLGFGATAGVAAMALVSVGAAAGTGFRFRPKFSWNHPATRQLLRLSGWTIGFVIANQVALIVVRNLATPGSSLASAYFTAFTFFVLPHGLLAVSISTTFQPEMARAVVRKDRPAFIAQTSLGLRMIALLTLPASWLMFALRHEIVGAVLQYENFSAQAAMNTSDAIGGFALGLVGFSMYQFSLRAFYAHQDTRSAFFVNVVENLINIGLAFVLVKRYGVFGLALSYALAYLISAFWTMQIVGYKVPGFRVWSILKAMWPMLVASVLCAEAAWLSTRLFGTEAGLGALARLVVGGTAGLCVYLGVLLVLRVPELDAARDRFPLSRKPVPAEPTPP